MKKKLLAMLLAGMMLLSLTACGGGDDKPPSSDPGKQSESTDQLTQKELDDVEKAFEMLEALKPEGWDENNFGAYIYDVWDEAFLPDCLPGPVDGVKVDLTPKEYELLFYLVQNKNIALSRDRLLQDIWGYDFFGDDRTLDTHIKLLRKQLGDHARYITTLRGVGYRFEKNA